MQADIAGLNLRKTRFGNRPDFAIGPSIEYTPREKTYGISATLSLPIWNTSKGEIESATAEQRKALADIEKLRQEIAGAVTKSMTRLDVARDQLGLYSIISGFAVAIFFAALVGCEKKETVGKEEERAK